MTWVAKWMVVWMLSSSAAAWACASCGSGGEDPLILYPNEKYKVYIGTSTAWNFRNIDADGQESDAGALERKSAVSIFSGIGFGPRSFISLGLPIVRNSSSQTSVTGLGDFGFSARYTLLMQNIAEPLLPQIQLIAGYKNGQAVSIHDSRRLRDLLDVRGSGFDELRAGVDIWHAVTRWKLGLAQVQVYSVPKRFDGVKYQPGVSSRSVLNVGYGLTESLRIGTGILREHKNAMSVDGNIVAESTQLSHRYFVNADLMIDSLTSMRFGLGGFASMLPSYNSFSSRQWNAAVMRSF